MTTSTRHLTALETKDGYRQFFMDVGLWRSHVEWVCARQSWTCNQVCSGVAGTFPTFVVDEQLVIKFFGPLFDGENCWRVEQEAAQLVGSVTQIPVAQLLAEGTLDYEPSWRFLVFEFIPGVSIGEVYTKIPLRDKLSMVRWLGKWLPRLHQIETHVETTLPFLSEDLARNWFSARWPEERERWPPHLVGQVEGYLSKNAKFFQSGHNCFIHADLTQDHFIGHLQSGHWVTRAIIDFGDAMLGNIFYELAALHLDLFDCDKRLLRVFLDAYGLPPDPDFVHKAMVTSLLHQFDIYAHLFRWKSELQKAGTLEELATLLWNIC